jgi:ADP-ribose pyrophosphatase YjhB (NUDIX family)
MWPYAMRPLPENETILLSAAGGEWSVTWHAAAKPPAGTVHGSAALCLTADEKLVVLVSEDGHSWGLPGGRPVEAEDWRQTLEREVQEEACSRVESASLLGFARSECVRGPRSGDVLVRSLWLATVEVGPWRPRHETEHRVVVGSDEALQRIAYTQGALLPLYARVFQEAGLL